MGRHGAHLRHVVHLGSLAHQVLDEVVLGVLRANPARKGIATPLFWSAIKLLAAQVNVIPELFIPGRGVELANSERPVPEGSHGLCEIGAATPVHGRRLTLS